jgi:hypothetical protein
MSTVKQITIGHTRDGAVTPHRRYEASYYPDQKLTYIVENGMFTVALTRGECTKRLITVNVGRADIEILWEEAQ